MTAPTLSTGSAKGAFDAPATQFLTVPGGTIAYDVAGDGPVVICVPSLGDLRAEYRFLRPILIEAGYRVVTMDLRGHGESSTGFSDYSSPAIGADIIALARQLDSGPVTVIGTSKAGGAAAWAAVTAPEVIGRLVLISAFVRAHDNDATVRRLMKVVLARPWGPSAWRWYFPKFYPSRKPADFDAYRAALKANLSQAGRLEALKKMALTSGDVSDKLGQVSAPALVVIGSKDPDFKDAAGEGEWIAEQIRGRSLVIEGAGHYPHAEMPEQVGPAIVAFLNDTRVGHAA